MNFAQYENAEIQEMLAALGASSYMVSDADYYTEIVTAWEQSSIIGNLMPDMDLTEAMSRIIQFPYMEGITPVKYDPEAGIRILQDRPAVKTAEGILWIIANKIPYDVLSLAVATPDMQAKAIKQLGNGFQKYRNEWLQDALDAVVGYQTFAAATANLLKVEDLINAKAKLQAKGYGDGDCIAFVNAQEAGSDLAKDTSLINAQYLYAAKGEMLRKGKFAYVPDFGYIFINTKATAGVAWVFDPLAGLETGHKIAFTVRTFYPNPITQEVWAWEARALSGVVPDANVKITAC